jgi:hypothetical protein
VCIGVLVQSDLITARPVKRLLNEPIVIEIRVQVLAPMRTDDRPTCGAAILT